MRLLFVLAVLCLVASSSQVVRAQASKPAPAERPVQLFMDDTLKFPIPDGWDVKDIADDTTSVLLKSDDNKGVLVVKTVPQKQSLTDHPEVRQKLGEAITKNLVEMHQNRGVEIVERPKLKQDDAYFIRIESKYRQDGKLVDQLFVYRALGIHLVYVEAATYDGTPERVAEVRKEGELLLMKIAGNRPVRRPGIPTGSGKPTLFRKARVQYTTGKGWVEEKKDAEAGVIATYREPMVGNGLISVRVTPVVGASADEVAAKVGREDLEAVTFDGTTPGAVESFGAGKTRRTYEGGGPKKRAENRTKIVGDVVVSITSSSNDNKADVIGQWVDALLESAQPFTRPGMQTK